MIYDEFKYESDMFALDRKIAIYKDGNTDQLFFYSEGDPILSVHRPIIIQLRDFLLKHYPLEV